MMTSLKVSQGALLAIACSVAFQGFAATPRARADTEPLLERARAFAEQRGAGSTLLANARGMLAEEAASQLDLQLAARQCVVLAAAAESGPDVELTLRTPEGLSLSDGEHGNPAAMRYCASAQREQVSVRVRGATNSPVAIGAWSVRRAGEALRPAPSLEPEPAPPAPVTLEGRFAQLVKGASAGMKAMTPPKEEKMGADETRGREIVLQEGYCYRVVAVAEEPSENLGLALVDPNGVGLSSEKGSQREAVLPKGPALCVQESGAYGLQLKIEGGPGRTLWQLFGAEPGPRWAVGGEEDTFLAKRVRQAHGQFKAGEAAMPFQIGELQTATKHDELVEVRAGECYLALAVGVPSLREVELEIMDHRGHVVARSEQQASTATARACATVNARWTVRTRAFKGYGGFGVQVFRAPK